MPHDGQNRCEEERTASQNGQVVDVPGRLPLRRGGGLVIHTPRFTITWIALAALLALYGWLVLLRA